MLVSIISFIFILGLLVLAHEFGHFITAKRAGVKVEEFGFGFPPRIFSWKKGETIYSLNLFPIGGFVKIYGEDGEKKEDISDKRAFWAQSLSRRALIITAGVIMNLLLAMILLSLGYWLGLPTVVDEGFNSGYLSQPQVQITQIAPNSPAEKADLRIGDVIQKMRFQNKEIEINKISEVQKFVDQYKGKEIILVIKRGENILEKKLIPRQNPPEGQGPMGVALLKTAIVAYPWYRAIVMGITSTLNLTIAILMALGGLLWQLISSGHWAGEMTGPVGIFVLTSQMSELGLIYLLQFTALLSINLAIINILPFPALDGGRLLFLLIEKLKGSPVSQKLEKTIHLIGFVILIILMLAITWRDILRFF